MAKRKFNALTPPFDLTADSVSDLSESFKSQSFQNLLKNGNFESWSAGASAAPDGWSLNSNATVAQEASIIKKGSYSVKVTNLAAGDRGIYQAITDNNYLKSRTFTFGCWVYATEANKARISIYDGATADHVYSSYHTGDSTWQFLTVTRTLSATTTSVTPCIRVDFTGDKIAYFDGAILVEGSVCPAFMSHPFDLMLAETRFKVGTFTRDTSLATGTQAITGVGFKPSLILFGANINGTLARSDGSDDLITPRNIYYDGATYSSGNVAILLMSSPSNYQIASLSSLDSDGFTLAWTKVNLPTGTGTIFYTAFR